MKKMDNICQYKMKYCKTLTFYIYTLKSLDSQPQNVSLKSAACTKFERSNLKIEGQQLFKSAIMPISY